MELGMPTARLTCSIDGPRRAIDGSQSPIDGAQGAIDGIRSVIDGARSVIDGALKAIDRAPVLDRWDSEPGRWGSEHAARPRPGRAGPRAVPRSLSRGGVRVGSRLHPADRGTGGAPGRVPGRTPRPAPRARNPSNAPAPPHPGPGTTPLHSRASAPGHVRPSPHSSPCERVFALLPLRRTRANGIALAAHRSHNGRASSGNTTRPLPIGPQPTDWASAGTADHAHARSHPAQGSAR